MRIFDTSLVPASRPLLPSRLLTVLVIQAVLLAGGTGQDAWAGCRDVTHSLQEALQARDLDAARRSYEAVDRESECADAYRARAKRKVSDLHAWIAVERMKSGESLRSQRALLRQGLDYARTWLVLALLGDVAYESRDYGRATEWYESALTVIRNEGETPSAPPVPTTERIHGRAQQSRLLARDFVPTPTNRWGRRDGLAAVSYRNFKPERVAVPITFRTDSAELTEKGRRFARDMAVYLKEQRLGNITLSAHTDQRGSEEYNLELSRRRGEAVKRFLRDQGVTQPIRVEAMGESRPFPLDRRDRERHTPEDLWQMDRRVELKR